MEEEVHLLGATLLASPREEPFVLAADVSQVFYVKDMSTKSKRGKNEDINSMINEPKHHIVLSGK